MTWTLPIDAILPDLIDCLRDERRAVLQAPPGAGKTTRVPLALYQAGLTDGRILMLEPRRLAARAAAERMAQTLGERVGGTVGYRIRGETKVSEVTRVEVVTEGILTRMLQNHQDLPGVGAVIFDEFHERSLNADLGLALCLETADVLREDLLLLAMSATLDAKPVAELMQAPILTSQGRNFDVDLHWLSKPRNKSDRLEADVAQLTLDVLGRETGSILVFLPGEAEIRRTHQLLAGNLPADAEVYPLFGAMAFKDQRRAIQAKESGRKIVLATSIAETSLTIDGIRVVIDAGLARRAEFDASSGMSRLVTTRVSRAEAVQRAGRAGRTEPGACYKLWTRGEDGILPAFAPAEIDTADLTGLALELAQWGTTANSLRFVTPPHAGRLAEANSVLKMLGAVDADGRITEHGIRMAQMPLHPRLAHMVALGGSKAPLLAALLSERDCLRGAKSDLSLRVDAAEKPEAFTRTHGLNAHQPTLKRVRAEAKRLARFRQNSALNDVAALAALAYPDRIGLRRPGDAPRFILSGGKGAYFSDGDEMARSKLIVATDLDGDPKEARIRQAAALSNAEFRALFQDQIAWQDVCSWSKRDQRVVARRQEKFGALTLDDRVWRDSPRHLLSEAMLDGVRELGLHLSPASRRLLARCALMRQHDGDFPDVSEQALMATIDVWLLPHLSGVTTAADWKAFNALPSLEQHIGRSNLQRLQREVPAEFVTPLGRKISIEYDGAKPCVSLRLQELFGVTSHPVAAGTPLQITLLSPAHRPVQVTEDLPGFWRTSYADVRKDMRGRYPKHPWPEDPTSADPTLRAKKRK